MKWKTEIFFSLWVGGGKQFRKLEDRPWQNTIMNFPTVNKQQIKVHVNKDPNFFSNLLSSGLFILMYPIVHQHAF